MDGAERLNRMIWNLFDMSKQLVKENIARFVMSGDLTLSDEQLVKLGDVIDRSIDQSFHRGIKALNDMIREVIGQPKNR